MVRICIFRTAAGDSFFLSDEFGADDDAETRRDYAGKNSKKWLKEY